MICLCARHTVVFLINVLHNMKQKNNVILTVFVFCTWNENLNSNTDKVL
jgi:hypothetical protein